MDVVSVTQATRTKIKSTGDPVVFYEGCAQPLKTIAPVNTLIMKAIKHGPVVKCH